MPRHSCVASTCHLSHPFSLLRQAPKISWFTAWYFVLNEVVGGVVNIIGDCQARRVFSFLLNTQVLPTITALYSSTIPDSYSLLLWCLLPLY